MNHEAEKSSNYSKCMLWSFIVMDIVFEKSRG